MRRVFYNTLILTLMLAIMGLTACAQTTKRYTYPAKLQLVWPGNPAKPRIKYIGSFSSAVDLGIEKGFFTQLAEFFVGAEEQRLIRPMAVAVLDDNEIFVADPGIRGVHYFNINAQKYKQIRLNGNAPMPSPVALSIDGQQQVLVVDSVLGKVFTINLEAGIAEPLELHKELEQPTGIAYDRNRRQLYVVDATRHCINVFNQQGDLLRQFGKRGKENAEFNYPTHIWLDLSGHVWVTDSLNFRVQSFTAEGKYLRQFGKLGADSGSFSRPKGVATDKFGHIYVMDALFHALQVFDKKGRLLLNIGQQGENPGQFWLPTGIYIGNNSKVYIADSHNQRIQVFEYIGDRS